MSKNGLDKSVIKCWGEFKLTEKKESYWRLGNLKLWCRQTEKEIQVAYKHDAETALR